MRARRVPGKRVAAVRLLLALAGALIGVLVCELLGRPDMAPAVGWVAGAVSYLALSWSALWPLDAAETAAHATREDPTRAASDALVLLAAGVGIATVVVLIASASAAHQVVSAVLGVLVVASVWFVVHTLFTLRYAALYYGGKPGGIEFAGSDAPDYGDFAYLSFTLGMTYQVSDQSLTDRAVRRVALRHSLLSYLLGAVVLGITINLLAGLRG